MKEYKITKGISLSIDENTKEVQFHDSEGGQTFMLTLDDLSAFQKFFLSESCPICKLSVKMTERNMKNLSLFT